MNKPAQTLNPEALAIACSDAMHSTDYCAQALDIRLIKTRPGYAEMQMTVRKDMSNGHGTCHGGMIFALADTAFAHSCNNANKNAVAAGCSIEYMAPAIVGDTLTASSQERSRSGRTGVYDVTINNQHGALLALFRGKSHQIKGSLIPETEED